jgi:hypothetical protein
MGKQVRGNQTDWTEEKQYFEGLIQDYEVYEQNRGGTARKGRYKSANQAAEANKGNEIRKYIAKIATAAVAREEKQDEITTNIRDSAHKKTEKMAAQLKMLSDAVAKLTTALANTMGGRDYWPNANRVTDAQKMHASYAGKSKPTA